MYDDDRLKIAILLHDYTQLLLQNKLYYNCTNSLIGLYYIHDSLN